MEQKHREGQLKEQLKKLRHFKHGRQTQFVDLQREARANVSSFADIQVCPLPGFLLCMVYIRQKGRP